MADAMSRQPRLTDRAAVKLALLLAIDTEESLVQAYANPTDTGAILARRNIVAFHRVLDRYFDGARAPKLPTGKTVSLTALMWGVPHTFDPNDGDR